MVGAGVGTGVGATVAVGVGVGDGLGDGDGGGLAVADAGGVEDDAETGTWDAVEGAIVGEGTATGVEHAQANAMAAANASRRTRMTVIPSETLDHAPAVRSRSVAPFRGGDVGLAARRGDASLRLFVRHPDRNVDRAAARARRGHVLEPEAITRSSYPFLIYRRPA